MVEEHQGIRLPVELQQVPSRILEEYVRARLIQFAGAFSRRVNPNLDQRLVQQAAAEAIASLPAPEFGRVAVENRDLQLVFRHDCLSLGCLDPQCVLCEHNPHRRCNVNFAPKYLVNDVLKAKCEAPIRVEIIDRATGVPLGEDIPDVQLEMCILDGNAYDAKCLEAGQEREEDLDGCSLLLNNKQTNPLLVPGGAPSHSPQNKVVVALQRGMAALPDLHVSDSSEAMLSGRKPPFRLLVRAAHRDGRKVNIRHAVSEGFVVATRRTRTAGKVEIPNVDDHVSKLEHMGKETVKKLQDIKGAAIQAGVDINIPENCINKVGEFRKLALMAEADGHLRQKLQQVLKLSKEKWDDARDHAMRAVVADNRMRIWYADKANMEVGLLFTCRLGNVDLDRPVGLLQKKSQEGTQTTMEATLMAQQTPAQREQVRQLQPQAVSSWWQPGHPGWAIYPVDSEHFMSTGALDNVSVPNESTLVAPPPPDSPGRASPPYNQMHDSPPYGVPFPNGMPPGGPPGGVDRPAGFLPGQHQMPPQGFIPPEASGGMPPYMGGGFRPPGMPPHLRLPPPGPLPGPQQHKRPGGPPSPFGMPPQQQAQHHQQQHPHQPQRPHAHSPNSHGGHERQGNPSPNSHLRPQSSQPSPFAQSANSSGARMDSMSAGFMATMFGQSSGALDRFQSSSINLGSFPSLPNVGGVDFDHIMQHTHHGNEGMMASAPAGIAHSPFQNMSRLGSMSMGKLESMELPETVERLLHDMPPDHRDQPEAGMPERANSGLESMQSIEQALGNVDDNPVEKFAEEYWLNNAQQGNANSKARVP
ncbi:PSII 6.1 kDa protein [Trebouxia sp. C0009 RCD-2024]